MSTSAIETLIINAIHSALITRAILSDLEAGGYQIVKKGG